MLEGRKRARDCKQLLVQIFSEEKPLVGDACPTQNVSSFGARVITKRSWLPNSRVILKSLEGDSWARARVVYCQPVNHKTFAVGLEFFVRAGEFAAI